MEPRPVESSTYVDAFARGLSVIGAFDAEHPELTLSEVAAIAGVSRAAARRLLLTLCHLGYALNNGRSFRLTPKVMRLGYAYLSGLPITDIVEPYVVDLAEKTGESCSVCVLDGHEVVYVARASTRRVMSLNLSVGTRLPAWATATGRILLGGLDEAERAERLRQSDLRPLTPRSETDIGRLEALIQRAHKDGHCWVNQELESGLTAVAMPLRDRGGQIVAAINVAGHAERNSKQRMLKDQLPLLTEAAAQINAALRATR